MTNVRRGHRPPLDRDTLARPIDRLLHALRALGPDSYRADSVRLGLWHATCPVCGRFTSARRLVIHEVGGGGATFRCRLECPRAAILAALALAERRYPAFSGWGWDTFDPETTRRVAESALAAQSADARLLRELDREASGA